MARVNFFDEQEMNPEMARLVENVKIDPGYYAGMKIFAHSQEFVAPVWTAYLELFDGGLVESQLKELVRIKVAQNNDCVM
jgi:hypothetical protein